MGAKAVDLDGVFNLMCAAIRQLPAVLMKTEPSSAMLNTSASGGSPGAGAAGNASRYEEMPQLPADFIAKLNQDLVKMQKFNAM